MPKPRQTEDVLRCGKRAEMVWRFLNFSREMTGKEGLAIVLDGPSDCCPQGLSMMEGGTRKDEIWGSRLVLCIGPGDGDVTKWGKAAGRYDLDMIKDLCLSYARVRPSVLVIDALPLEEGSTAARKLYLA